MVLLQIIVYRIYWYSGRLGFFDIQKEFTINSLSRFKSFLRNYCLMCIDVKLSHDLFTCMHSAHDTRYVARCAF